MKKESRFNLLTRIILAIIIGVSVLKYMQFDITEILPINLGWIAASQTVFHVIVLFIFFLLFYLTFTSFFRNASVFTWAIILFINLVTVGAITYNYSISSQAPDKKETIINSIISSHSYEYTLGRYLFNISYSLLWIIICFIVLFKIYKISVEIYNTNKLKQ